MLTIANQIDNLYYKAYFYADSIDEEVLQRATNTFNYYKGKGIITNELFEDDIWSLKDEIMRLKIVFKFSISNYEKFTYKWIGCSAECFKEAMKAYIALHIGHWGFRHLYYVSSILLKLTTSDFSEKYDILKEKSIYVLEFLQFLPGMSVNRKIALERLEDITNQYRFKGFNTGNRRNLLSFKDYFRFDKELNAYWIRANTEKKVYYFPLYLWWKLTTILPLRVTEFLLIPRDCISCDNKGNFFITIRRSKMKGNGKLLKHYNIDKDYNRNTYPIPDNIANEIIWYKKSTDSIRGNSIDTLFCIEAYRMYRSSTSYDIYTYRHFAVTKKDFYEDALKNKEIPVVKLGDTRHIAMISLIISGGSPRMCMELAGHSDIDISSHYYTNIVSLVECATYELYRNSTKGASAKINGSNVYQLTKSEDWVKVSDGWCASSFMRSGEIDDCINSMNSLGEIGDCKCCKYFRRYMQGQHLDFFDENQNKQKVLANSWFVVQMIEAVRNGIGCKEDLYQAILKLQHSCCSYRDFLLGKYEMEEKYGKTQENK